MFVAKGQGRKKSGSRWLQISLLTEQPVFSGLQKGHPLWLILPGTKAPHSGRAPGDLTAQVHCFYQASREGTDAVSKKTAFQEGQVRGRNYPGFPGRK